MKGELLMNKKLFIIIGAIVLALILCFAFFLNRDTNVDVETPTVPTTPSVDIIIPEDTKPEEDLNVTIPTEPENETIPPETVPEETKPTEPEKEEVTFTKCNKTMYVNVEALTYREGPGTEYKAKGYLRFDVEVKVIAIGSNGWYKIKLDDKEFCVAGNCLSNIKYIDTITFTECDKTMIVNVDELTVNIGPDEKYVNHGFFLKDTKVDVIGMGSNGWCKIRYIDKTMYVDGSCLRDIETEQTQPSTNPV